MSEAEQHVGFIRINKFHAVYDKASFNGYTPEQLFALREHWDNQLKLLNEVIDEHPDIED